MDKDIAGRLATLALAGFTTICMQSHAAAFEIASQGGVKVSDPQESAYWFSLGGLLQFDQLFRHASVPQTRANFPNSANLRRAHLFTQGGIGETWQYYFGVDFANVSTPEWINAYLSYQGIENSNLQAGLITQAFSQNRSSVAALTTMERSMMQNVNAFFPKEGLGIYGDHTVDDVFLFSASVWAPHPSSQANNAGTGATQTANRGSDLLGVSGRATFSPVHTENVVWHFAASALYQKLHARSNPPDYALAIPLERKGRDWPGFMTKQLSLSKIGTRNWSAGSFEVATAFGPFSVQAEYMGMAIKAVPDAQSQHYKGAYALAAYTLTGESRPYDMTTGFFGKIKPAGSGGALEAFMQYSILSMRDHGVGPIARVGALGVNWYATQDVRVSFQYDRMQYDRLDGTQTVGNGPMLLPARAAINVYGLRFQADFTA